MQRLVDLLFAIPAAWAMGAVFLLTAAEASLFFGFVIPGEIAVVLGGVLASRGTVSLSEAIAAAITGAILGDLVGYAIGRHFGAPLLERRFPRHWPKVRAWIQRRGGAAVFLGRATAFLRAVVPTAAGAAQMPLPRFLLWDVLGGVSWGAGFTLLGYFAGEGYEATLARVGRGSLGALVLIALLGGLLVLKSYLIQRWSRETQEL
jgi:membrane protein DedA with SNARE-associated domain